MTAAEFEDTLKEEFPKFKIRLKSSSMLMKVLNVLLKIITLGQMKTFMTQFTTVVSYTMYVTDSWSSRSEISRMLTLRHERIHFRQRKKYGAFFFTVLYTLLPFPIGLAYFRMKFEREAYEETMRALLELQPRSALKTLKSHVFRDRMVGHFTKAEYFWMWPFRKSLERWYDETVARLEKEAGA